MIKFTLASNKWLEEPIPTRKLSIIIDCNIYRVKLVKYGQIKINLRAIFTSRLKVKLFNCSALEFVNKEVYSRMRDNTFKLLVTMTDGDATDARNEVEIEWARAHFDMMYAVGVGHDAHHDKLIDFANAEKHVGYVDDFQHLHDIVYTLHDSICGSIYNVVQSKR